MRFPNPGLRGSRLPDAADMTLCFKRQATGLRATASKNLSHSAVALTTSKSGLMDVDPRTPIPSEAWLAALIVQNVPRAGRN